MAAIQSSFYVTGGTLQRDARSYVRRQADAALYAALQQGQFAYVLTSRQMGKSSLMVRTCSAGSSGPGNSRVVTPGWIRRPSPVMSAFGTL